MRVRDSIFAACLALGVAGGTGCKPTHVTFDTVNPGTGRLSGGEEVRIRGAGMGRLGNVEVRIGGRMALNVGLQGDDTIVLTTPEGRETDAGHPLDISLLTSDGRSIILRGAFQYRPGASPRGTGGPNEDLRRRL